ncbi:hypothetical protein SLS62_007852 [Diatrype stigma]|uniref:Uncharacterized protein n=1 Tax=Diatrype stigma TaxID=117547 RepID=A0AAN9UP24_9PEZI
MASSSDSSVPQAVADKLDDLENLEMSDPKMLELENNDTERLDATADPTVPSEQLPSREEKHTPSYPPVKKPIIIVSSSNPSMSRVVDRLDDLETLEMRNPKMRELEENDTERLDTPAGAAAAAAELAAAELAAADDYETGGSPFIEDYAEYHDSFIYPPAIRFPVPGTPWPRYGRVRPGTQGAASTRGAASASARAASAKKREEVEQMFQAMTPSSTPQYYFPPPPPMPVSMSTLRRLSQPQPLQRTQPTHVLVLPSNAAHLVPIVENHVQQDEDDINAVIKATSGSDSGGPFWDGRSRGVIPWATADCQAPASMYAVASGYPVRLAKKVLAIGPTAAHEPGEHQQQQQVVVPQIRPIDDVARALLEAWDELRRKLEGVRNIVQRTDMNGNAIVPPPDTYSTPDRRPSAVFWAGLSITPGP